MGSVGQVLSVAVVFALLALAVWRFRAPGTRSARLWGRGGGEQLRVLERVALTPQHSLHLVSLGPDVLLIGAGPGGIELIRQGPAPTAARSDAIA